MPSYRPIGPREKQSGAISAENAGRKELFELPPTRAPMESRAERDWGGRISEPAHPSGLAPPGISGKVPPVGKLGILITDSKRPIPGWKCGGSTAPPRRSRRSVVNYKRRALWEFVFAADGLGPCDVRVYDPDAKARRDAERGE